MRKRYINNLINLSFLLGSLIFSLVLAELFFRLFPEYGSRCDFGRFAVENELVVEAMNRDRDYRMHRPSSILGYEIIPNSVPGVNSFGMIGREHKLEKDKNSYRILVLGDSITEHNWYVERLEDKLNNSNPKLDYKFELWNGGVMGYQVNQYAAYLRYKGLKYNPDMVIIGFCLNDFETLYWVYYKDENGFTIFYNPARELSKRFPSNEFFFRHSYLYRFLLLQVENLLSNSKERFPDPKAEGLYYLKTIKDICQENKIILLGVIFPYFKRLSEYNDYEMDRYKEIIEVLESLNIDYIDLHKHFPEEGRYALRRDKEDSIHPSIEGHKIIADAIYGYLLKNYFKNH